MTLKHILGLLIRNVHYAQVILQIKFHKKLYQYVLSYLSVNILIDLNYT